MEILTILYFLFLKKDLKDFSRKDFEWFNKFLIHFSVKIVVLLKSRVLWTEVEKFVSKSNQIFRNLNQDLKIQ